MADAHLKVFRGTPVDRGDVRGVRRARGGGDGRPRRPPLDPGARRPGPGRPLELQGGEVRLVQRRGQRPAEPHLQDAALGLRGGRDDHGRADAGVPARPRPRHRRLLELRGQPPDPAVPAAGRQAAGGVALAAGGHRAGPGVPEVHRVLPLPGRLPRPPQPRDEAAVHGPALPRPERRPRDAPDRQGRPAASTSRTRAASRSATSRSAAPRSARSTSRSPTTRSSRSRSGSPIGTTTRSRCSCGRFAGGRRSGKPAPAGQGATADSRRSSRRRPTGAPPEPTRRAARRSGPTIRDAAAGRLDAPLRHPHRRRGPRQPRARPRRARS